MKGSLNKTPNPLFLNKIRGKMNKQETIPDMSVQIRCVSHEIRNHLSVCDMYAQIIRKNLIKSGIENPSIENAIDCIQQSVKIIESNLLDLKSLNRNEPHIVDFERIINRGVELSRAYIIDKEIDMELFTKNTAKINIDENRFLAVIVNIIKNAIEAIQLKGKIEILAEIKNSKGIIRISNDGKCIPKEKQSRLFNQGYTTKETGSGLGLWLCKKYLEEQNATLTLLRSTKKQTTFEISVPIVE